MLTSSFVLSFIAIFSCLNSDLDLEHTNVFDKSNMAFVTLWITYESVDMSHYTRCILYVPNQMAHMILTFGPYITLMCSKIKDPYFTLSDCDSDTWESRWNFSLIFWKRYRLFTKWSPFFFFRVGIFEFLNFKMLNDQLIIALSLVISFLFILNLILTIYLACFKRAIFGRPITISHRSANAELPGTNHGFVVERSEKS